MVHAHDNYNEWAWCDDCNPIPITEPIEDECNGFNDPELVEQVKDELNNYHEDYPQARRI